MYIAVKMALFVRSFRHNKNTDKNNHITSRIMYTFFDLVKTGGAHLHRSIILPFHNNHHASFITSESMSE